MGIQMESLWDYITVCYFKNCYTVMNNDTAKY